MSLIRRWMEFRNWRPADLAEEAGVTAQAVNDLIRPGVSHRRRTIQKYAVVFGVSEEEFLRGPKPVSYEPGPGEFVYIPHYAVPVAAGGGTEISHEPTSEFLAFRADWVRNTLHANPKDLFLVDVYGDSMTPTLLDGDIVLVNQQLTNLSSQGLYVFRRSGLMYVKRLELRLDGRVSIKSDNTRYSEEFFTPEEATDLNVFGRVLWYGRAIV